MDKLVGLISSGIDLAIEAAAEYQTSNKTNKSVGKRTNSYYQQDLTYGSRDFYSEDHQNQQDAKAFQELQSYADFQRALSDRVQDDILRDEWYTPIDPQLLPQDVADGDYFSHRPFVHPSLRQPSFTGRLPCPVIIPQRRPEDKSRGWVRAYAPALMYCGIDQYTFLNFLDAFNESSKSLPYLDAINVAGFGVGFAPSITPMLVSMAVPVAVRMAKTAQAEKKTTSFLDCANIELFAPHGLFAMVMTYKPTTSSQTYTVDSQRVSQDTRTSNEPQLPTSATLIFPEPEYTPSVGQQNKFKQISHFITDYGDRRAQARYAFEHPDSYLSTGPAPTFRSRWGDPNNPANSGSLSSLITGRPKERDDKRKERKERRRKSGSSSKSSSEERGSDRPGLIRSMRGMVNGNSGETDGKEDRGLIKGLQGLGMKKDVLYLLIVNSPTNDSLPSSFDNAQTQTPDPYREAKRIKSPDILEPNPFQQPGIWMPNSGVGWLSDDRFTYERSMGYQSTPGSRARSPPPAYESPQNAGRYEKIGRKVVGDYCVPTL